MPDPVILAIPIQTSSRAGVALTETAAVGDFFTFINSSSDILLVVNNVTPIVPTTVTIDNPMSVDGLNVPDRTITVLAGKISVIGPFPKAVYNQTTGIVKFALSAVTDVKLSAVKPGSPAY